ncbi:MAG TPA: DUF1775 domain-containing protein, partial [Baekduia sp.]
KAGDTLTFKALQNYSNGEIARWIGAPDADKPAPQLTVTAADAPAAATTAATATPATPAAVAPASSDDGSSDTLSIVALIVGALGLLAGGAGLAAARKRA